MKYLNIFFALMFMAFAFLQVNDPDPVLWIIIYGTMAVLSVMAIFESYNRKVLVVLAVLLVAYGVFLLPGVSEWLRQDNLSILFDEGMKMQHLYVEEAREFLGLVICLLVLIIYLFRAFRQKLG